MSTGSFHVMLPGGRNIDIFTREGADEFVSSGSPFISQNIADDKGIVVMGRQEIARGNLSRDRRSQLEAMIAQTYIMCGVVADVTSDEGFKKIPRKELECFIKHACSVFGSLANDPKWTLTGVLSSYDGELLGAIIPSMKRLSYVELAIVMGLLSTIAKLCAARKGLNMPCIDVADSILKFARNLQVSLTVYGAKYSAEKIFKLFEATGLLPQILRCVTLPPGEDDTLQVRLDLLDDISACNSIVKKKLKLGQPSGDVLLGIIEGKDGSKERPHEAVWGRLVNLTKLADIHNNWSAAARGSVGRTCRTCNKTGVQIGDEKLFCCR
jgi:hypothetical protein